MNIEKRKTQMKKDWESVMGLKMILEQKVEDQLKVIGEIEKGKEGIMQGQEGLE